MVLSEDLISKGYTIEPVAEEDLDQYMKIREDFLKPFVDQYNGGWVDDIQRLIAVDLFHRARKDSSFWKIRKEGKSTGFLAYREGSERIADISVMLSETGQEKEIMGEFLDFITRLSDRTGKPVLLMVYKTAPLLNLYMEHGFIIYGTSRTHYLMSYNIEDISGMGDYKNRLSPR